MREGRFLAPSLSAVSGRGMKVFLYTKPCVSSFLWKKHCAKAVKVIVALLIKL